MGVYCVHGLSSFWKATLLHYIMQHAADRRETEPRLGLRTLCYITADRTKTWLEKHSYYLVYSKFFLDPGPKWTCILYNIGWIFGSEKSSLLYKKLFVMSYVLSKFKRFPFFQTLLCCLRFDNISKRLMQQDDVRLVQWIGITNTPSSYRTHSCARYSNVTPKSLMPCSISKKK